MNFKDIKESDILEFLKINHVTINKDIYIEALNIINKEDTKLTLVIENWLINYENKEMNYFNQLNDDLLLEILVTIKKFNMIKLLSKTIYNQYKSIVNSNLFKLKLGQKILKKKNYKQLHFNINLFNTIYSYQNYIITAAGKMFKCIDYCIYLSKNYKIYKYENLKWCVANIKIPIHNIIYTNKYGFVYLSEGYIYTGVPEWLECYNYKVRCHQYKPAELTKLNIGTGNILFIDNKDNSFKYVDLNGTWYNYD